MTIHQNHLRRNTLLALMLTTAVVAPALNAAPAKKVAPVNVPLITVTEPTERAYTTKVPKGWRNQVYLARKYQMHRSIMTSLSPDGQTLLFSGDPRMPSYQYPNQYTQMQGYEMIARLNPLSKVSNYVPSKTYFTQYVKSKFGKLPNFRITSTTANPEALQLMRNSAQRTGIQARNDAVRIRFSYTDKGKTMNALLNGITMSNNTIWVVDTFGITTTGDPMRYSKMLNTMYDSTRVSPQWKQQQQALHEQRMAQLQNDHQNQLANWSASNQRHELRMQAIQDAGNASMQKWYQNQAKSDDSHRRFLNTITEEKTVLDKSGNAFQVDNSHQRYFVNKYDKSYVGTNSHTSINDLYGMGFDAGDYEEVRVKQ